MLKSLPVHFTHHAKERMYERGVSREHIQGVVGMVDPSKVPAGHKFKRWGVVVLRKEECWLVITTYQ